MRLLKTVVLAAWAGGCVGTQPVAPCLVARSGTPFLMKWTMQTGGLSRACQTTLADFDLSTLSAERYGSVAGENRDVFLRPSEFGFKTDVAATALAKGELERNDVGADATCAVDFTQAATVSFTSSDPGTVLRTATYEFKKVTSLSDAPHGGTQIQADLLYTRDGCSAEFHGLGVNPAVGCATDAECGSSANYDAGRTSGSGILPDYPVTCVADVRAAPFFGVTDGTITGFCELQGSAFPVLKTP